MMFWKATILVIMALHHTTVVNCMGNDWTIWGPWSKYDVTCGNQTRMRTRTCDVKIPWLKCIGDRMSEDMIFKYPCPTVDPMKTPRTTTTTPPPPPPPTTTTTTSPPTKTTTTPPPTKTTTTSTTTTPTSTKTTTPTTTTTTTTTTKLPPPKWSTWTPWAGIELGGQKCGTMLRYRQQENCNSNKKKNKECLKQNQGRYIPCSKQRTRKCAKTDCSKSRNGETKSNHFEMRRHIVYQDEIWRQMKSTTFIECKMKCQFRPTCKRVALKNIQNGWLCYFLRNPERTREKHRRRKISVVPLKVFIKYPG